MIEGVTMPVARVGHLVALKVLARDDRRRPQDLVDLRMLLQVADATELAAARAALAMITARGFARGKDLAAELESLLAG